MEGVALLAVSVMGVLGNLLLLGRLARLPRQSSLAILPCAEQSHPCYLNISYRNLHYENQI